MSKVIALAVGMAGIFYSNGQSAGQRAEITHIWSETCVNIKITSGAGFGAPDPTSVFVPPLGTPADRHPGGYYFLPDAFIEAARADSTVEQAIVHAGADKAPRVTPADIEANIASEHYFTALEARGAVAEEGNERWHGLLPSREVFQTLGLLTFCVLVLKNGFTVTGESACASPENYNAEIGRRIARENAVDKIWPLMGYELRSRLAAG